jgi:Uma2 family endonuclease
MHYDEFEEKTSYVNEPDLAGYYTASDFMKWSYKGFVELIRGKIFKLAAAPSTAHQITAKNLVKHFFRAFDDRPCQFFFAPFDVYLLRDGEDYHTGTSVVEPDICVVCDSTKLKSKGCFGVPDLIVEVLSPGNVKNDTQLKYALYEEYGVKEYWIVDPIDLTVSQNILDNGIFRSSHLTQPGQQLQSALFPDLTITLHEVFPNMRFED